MVHVFCKHLSPGDESARNPKPKGFSQVERNPSYAGSTIWRTTAHEKGAQTGDDTIRGAQVGSTFTATIEDQELMLDEHRLGNDGTQTSRSC